MNWGHQMIETADGILWTRMPNPPFQGEPWVGTSNEKRVIIPTEREVALLDALEVATNKEELELDFTVSCKECGEDLDHDMESERLDSEHGGIKIEVALRVQPCECIVIED